MRRRHYLGLLALFAWHNRSFTPRTKQFARWEKEIAAFEKADQIKMPAENAILFVGSSTIRGWNLAKSFPGVPTNNRGFGGSQIADVVHFAPRIIAKYKPPMIVFTPATTTSTPRKHRSRSRRISKPW